MFFYLYIGEYGVFSVSLRNFIKIIMKSPEYIAHGTSSEKDAQNIWESGFEVQEGRATVSTDLIYAFEWATTQEKRKGSKSTTKINGEEAGRIIIMDVPSDTKIDYATHTEINVNEDLKEVSGYPSKYVSGRRQLAIYNERDIAKRKKQIEIAKSELKDVISKSEALFQENNIEPKNIKSRDDFLEAIKNFDIDKQIDLIKKVEELEKIKVQKRQEAELETSIPQENVLMSIIPTEKLGEKLKELKGKLDKLENIDLLEFSKQITEIISSDMDNDIAANADVGKIISNLIESTVKTEIIRMIRSISLDVKRVQGYTVFNRDKDEIKDKEVDRLELEKKLKRINAVVTDDNFDIGVDSLNRYIKVSIKKFIEEIK